ncbi:hypothetical protein OZX72_02845 [Bifidobacterium sp. ESL0769]|uniref:hypothetical protein n=1 Tax=Bifidobacterium sp. ESL0769 TaxID=2983229 RepID=UPI0023FA32A0|nr:hypothetical protein [Bifidobacterium sp. ESL0769]WEV67939.1 hypothetical protein OZX72_02845 [Bifidobacterium sp. ESL0769]
MKKSSVILGMLIAFAVVFPLLPLSWDGMNFHWSGWSEWWAFGTFLVAIFALIVAFKEYKTHVEEQNSRIKEKIQEEKRHDREVWDTLRAYVEVSYVFDKRGAVMVSVANVGNTSATDINVSFDPEIKAPPPEEPNDKIAEYFSRFRSRAISSIAPHSRFLFILDVNNEVQQHIDSGILVRKTVATVKYKDTRGQTYADKFVLDFDDWLGAIEEKTSGDLIHDELRKIGNDISDLAKLKR